MAQRRRVLDESGGPVVSLLSGLLEGVQERQQAKGKQANELEQIRETGRATARGKQEFPDAQEQMNQQILKLIMQMIPQEPTTAESVAAAPSTIVPGPSGGYVGGGEGSEVAAGMPSRQAPIDVIAGMGRPNVMGAMESKRMQAQKTLEALGKFGIGTLSAPRGKASLIEELQSAGSVENDTLPDPTEVPEGTVATLEDGRQLVAKQGRWQPR